MKLKPLLALLVLPAATIQAQNAQPLTNAVLVQGRAEVRVPNTRAVIELGFHAAGPDEAGVREDVSRRSQAVSEALKKSGAARIQTGSVAISPQFHHPDANQRAQAPKITGYTAHATLGFEVPVGEAARIITASVEAGANSISSFQTHPAEDVRRGAERDALAAAVKDAETQARTVLSAAALEWTGIRGIDASAPGATPFAMPRAAMMSAGAPAPDLAIEAGETVIGREVTMQVGFKAP